MRNNKKSIQGSRKRTDLEKLRLFVKKVDELQNTRLAKIGFSFQRKIHYEIGKPVTHSLEQPDEADLKDFLMTFRNFIAEQEDTFLDSIFNICHRRIINDEIKQDLIQKRQLLKQIKLHNWTGFNINGSDFTPVQITDIYLNATYFHNELEHQLFLENLSLFPLASEELRSNFLNYVINVSKIVSYLGGAINYALTENLFLFEEKS